MPFLPTSQQHQSTEGNRKTILVKQKLKVACIMKQRQGGTSAAASVEMSVDVTSKSATNLAMSRARPVSVPVHKLAEDPAFRELVSHYIFHIAFCNDDACHTVNQTMYLLLYNERLLKCLSHFS